MKHSLEIATKALALCAGAFLFGGQVWAKDEPVVLAQSEKWVANFDTDFCALTTAFGSDDSKIFVRLTRFQPDDPFILELFGKALKSNDPRSKIKIAFGPNGNVVEIQTTNGTNGKLPMMVLGYQDLLNRKSIPNQFRPPISPDQEAAVSTLDVAVPGLLHRKRPRDLFAVVRVRRRGAEVVHVGHITAGEQRGRRIGNGQRICERS